MRIRLLVVIAITLAMSPLLAPPLNELVVVSEPASVLQIIVAETLKGMLIGFIGRLFMAAVEFAGSIMASMSGFSALPGVPIEGNEALPAMASLMVVSATLLILVTDLHWMVLFTIADSYTVLPAGSVFEAQASLVAVSDKLLETTLLAGRLAAPFIIYSILVNFAMGLTAKLTPQIPIFFVSLPFILAGGLLIWLFTAGDVLSEFTAGMAGWLGGF